MADTKISDFGDIPALDQTNDRIPILDVSGTGTAKNKLIAPTTLMASKLDLTGGTVTGQLVLTNASATGALNITPIWNDAGTNFTAFKVRATNTDSGAGSLLMDLGTVADGSFCSLDKSGKLTIGPTTINQGGLISTLYVSAEGILRGNTVAVGNSNQVHLSHNGNGNLCLRGYADIDPFYSLELGITHATVGTTCEIKGHTVTTGTGGGIIISGGPGSVAKGDVKLNGGNRAAYDASPSSATIRDILISHGLMAAS